VNDIPTTYYSKGMGKYNEFKANDVIGLPPTMGEYSEVETTVPYWDPSGGPAIQRTPLGYWRSGTTSSWSKWTTPLGQLAQGATSGFPPPGPTK
jgi:hypothetical protein